MIAIATPEDCVVQWPGSFPEKTFLNNYYKELPYQEGKELGYSTTETTSSDEEAHTPKGKRYRRRTIYMAEVTELLVPPKVPDVHSSDESETNITLDEKTNEGETEEHKQARINRNKQ